MKTELIASTINEALKSGQRVRVPQKYLHLVSPQAAATERTKEGEVRAKYLQKDIDAAIQRYADQAQNPHIKNALQQLHQAEPHIKLQFIESATFDATSLNPVMGECDKEKVCEQICSPISKVVCEWVCEQIDGKNVCNKICETVVDELCKTVCSWICQ